VHFFELRLRSQQGSAQRVSASPPASCLSCEGGGLGTGCAGDSRRKLRLPASVRVGVGIDTYCGAMQRQPLVLMSSQDCTAQPQAAVTQHLTFIALQRHASDQGCSTQAPSHRNGRPLPSLLCSSGRGVCSEAVRGAAPASSCRWLLYHSSIYYTAECSPRAALPGTESA